MSVEDILDMYEAVAGRRCFSTRTATMCDAHRSKWSLGTIGCDTVAVAACRAMAMIRDEVRKEVP